MAYRKIILNQFDCRRWVHTRLTGEPTFVKGHKTEGGIGKLLLAFFGSFAVTVGVLKFSYAGQESSRELRPVRYGSFEVQEARKTTSPSIILKDDDQKQSEHIYLKIRAPLSKEAARLSSTISKFDQVQILSIHMKEPTLQIERPYTPLYSDPLYGFDAPVELLVRRYPDGELGKYAHRLNEDLRVELRGPKITWQGPKVDHFVMLVGGTGITPAYQLINTLISQSSHLGTSMPKITLLYGSSKRSSVLLSPELANLKRDFPEHFDIHLFVDEIDIDARAKVSWTDWFLRRPAIIDGMQIKQGRIDESITRNVLEGMERENPNKSRIILVCGPDSMVEAIAGPKQGQLQGHLGGILGRLQCSEDEVWKL